MSDKPTSRNADGVFEPFPIEQVPWESYSRGERFALRYQHLSSFGGGTQISIANEILPPGKQANQSHYHMLEEEHSSSSNHEVAVFPDTGRVEVKLMRQGYRQSAAIGYWEGVDVGGSDG